MFTVLCCDVGWSELGGAETCLPPHIDEVEDEGSDYRERVWVEYRGAMEEFLFVYHWHHALT